MFQGKLQAIFVGPEGAGSMRQLESVRAVAGSGLEGDRYSTGQGTFSKDSSPNKHYPADRQVTLIEAEAIEAAAQRLRGHD